MDSADDFIAAHETTLPKSQNKVEKYLLHIEDNVAAGISLPHPAFLQTRVPFFVALVILLPSASVPDSEEDED